VEEIRDRERNSGGGAGNDRAAGRRAERCSDQSATPAPATTLLTIAIMLAEVKMSCAREAERPMFSVTPTALSWPVSRKYRASAPASPR
jgi:hypothetical protein